MPSRNVRMVVGVGLGFLVSLTMALINFGNVSQAVRGSLQFTVLLSIIVLLLHVAARLAERKGYPTWVGIVALVVFNVFGFVLLWLLPHRRTVRSS